MGVDPELHRFCLLLFPQETLDRLDDFRNLMRQGAAVCVAERQALGPALNRLFKGSECILRTCLEAVKEMLGIVNQIFYVRPEIPERVLNDDKVVLKTDTQGIGDMHVPGLAENSNTGCFRIKKGLQVGIGLSRILEIPGAAERGEAGMLQVVIPDLTEELNRARIGPGPPSFNIINTKLVKLQSNFDLVFNRKIEVFSLGPIS